MKKSFFTQFLITIFILFPVIGWSASQYILTDLGVPPHALGLAINDFGEIAGNSSSGQFLWAEGEFVYLISGGSGSAHGINNFSQVVGYSGSPFKATLWENGSITILPSLSGQNDHAYDINDKGYVVGDSRNASGVCTAVYWSPDNQINEIVASNSTAHAINEKNQIVGESSFHAFFWENGQLTDIGVLPGGNFSVAYDINEMGQVVGRSHANGTTDHAFLWEDGVMHDLGTLELGGHSIANAINNKGQIVGSASGVSSGGAVLWENGQIYNLNNLLVTETDWVLFDAKDINDQGYIIGRMEKNSQARAFLLTPVPEPSKIPIADAGSDQEVFAGSDCFASIILDGSSSFDPDGDPLTYSWIWDGGAATGVDPTIELPVGIHIITLVVNDGTYDSEPDTVVIAVIDNDPPKISLSLSPNTLWPPNHKMVPINATISATDNCDKDPVCKITSVSSNEPVNEKGKGYTTPDWEITGDLGVNLRSERSGNGNGRIYTIAVECTDEGGNSATKNANVYVSHDNKGKKK